MSSIEDLFTCEEKIDRVKNKLPILFALAEKEASRGGKLGMEIGSVRERILIALLIHYFGKDNVDTDVPITDSEIDVKLFDRSISIKTKTGTGTSGIKAVWTVDWDRAKQFVDEYQPSLDIILVRIVWSKIGGMYLIPLSVQQEIFDDMGFEKYMKLPPKNTNPRGVEYASEVVKKWIEHEDTKHIEIKWERPEVDLDVYQHWVDQWAEN